MNLKEVTELYDSGMSPYEIAEQTGTYPNKIRRALKKAGVVLRDKGESQAAAFKSGRKKHPTAGTVRSDETKTKISIKAVEYWENISDDKYDEHVEAAKDRWEKIPKKKKIAMQKKANEAIRAAAENGSKAENYLAEIIRDAGFTVQQHSTNAIKNNSLEIDIYIPAVSTIIELDGVSHFEPIWGADRFKKAQRADAEKSGLILRNGLVLIRIKYMARRLTNSVQRQLQEKVLPLLESFKTKFPTETNRYIEIEVN